MVALLTSCKRAGLLFPASGGLVVVGCAGVGLLRRVTIAGIVLALALLAACGAFSEGPGQEVPFETVHQSDYSRYTGKFWPVDAPGIAVIADPADVEQLDAFVTPDSQMQLRTLDYDTYFALVALFESECVQRYGVEQVLLREDELEVYAIYPEHDPQIGCGGLSPTPYEVIQLPREGVWEDATRFTLYINGEHAVSASYPPVVSQATLAPTPTQEPILAQTPRPTETPSPPE